MAMNVKDANLVPVGYQQVATGDLDPAISLTIPENARTVLMQAEGNDIRWLDSGGTPDATTGTILAVGDSFHYTAKLEAVQLFSVAGIANLTYYK